LTFIPSSQAAPKAKAAPKPKAAPKAKAAPKPKATAAAKKKAAVLEERDDNGAHSDDDDEDVRMAEEDEVRSLSHSKREREELTVRWARQDGDEVMEMAAPVAAKKGKPKTASETYVKVSRLTLTRKRGRS
jgi:hypothetical protein